MPEAPAFATCLAPLLAAPPQRVWSLLVTIFGDAVAPRGGELALASLLAVTAAFGIHAGAVRTAISRLAAEGWLAGRRCGRHSFYRLGERGRAEFASAAGRVYRGPAEPAWDGTWQVLVLAANGAAERDRLRGEGWAALAPQTFVRPLPSGRPDGVGPLLFHARLLAPEDGRALAATHWPLEQLAAAYTAFTTRFAPLAAAAARDPAIEPLDALVARILLVHDFRRLALRDPQLPPSLLPAGWSGAAARQLCARLYLDLRASAERWLDEHGRNAAGPLPAPDAAFADRFGACP